MSSRNWQKIKSFDYYPKALLVAIPFACIALLEFYAIPVADLFFADWALCLISIPNFFSNQLATAAYFGRTLDMTVGQSKNQANKELFGTILGIAAGAIAGIALIAFGVPVPFASSLSSLAYAFFTLRYINIFAGFGNRLGRCFDTSDQKRPLFEKIFVATAEMLGLMLGASLFYLNLANYANIQGALNFFTPECMPTLLAGTIYTFSIGSLFGSSADYVVKAIIRLISSDRKTENPTISPKKTVNKNLDGMFHELNAYFHGKKFYTGSKHIQRFHEYDGSYVGVLIGVGVAALNIWKGITKHLPGPIGTITRGLLFVSSTSSWGGTAARVGRLVDAFTAAEEKLQAETIPTNPINTHALARTKLTKNKAFLLRLASNTNTPATATTTSTRLPKPHSKITHYHLHARSNNGKRTYIRHHPVIRTGNGASPK